MTNLTSEDDEISFQGLTYLIGDAHYGGRITDKHDNLLLNLILKKYINENIFKSTF